MTSKVIPFPTPNAAPKDDVLLIVRRRVVMKVGAREFSVDMTAKVRPLPDARVSSVLHAATVYSIPATVPPRKQVESMNRETKFLHLRTAAMLGERINGWRVCWLGGWDRGRLFYLVMVERMLQSSGGELSLP